ncbi:phycobilisome linker polypeptide [Rubidibacter lacunae KORDI 51-2]|uniref:Phycobilisome linker polypeptide n=1 Tax=Rubidibacter lacunae KORDI 51-2 TaxID=582515 RepID=U5DK26_9CHRO|nr:phycobilisome rod-core linker polypeptide [Rubidibacter lacunae]ERN40035.1 phycobilisome linker polypeptide [Rubidibacter lacunae KORDI 51-2]
MPIPLLNYAPTCQNQRVDGYEVGSEERMQMGADTSMTTASDVDAIIWAAYRQVFGEHQILKSNRQPFLESQLRFGQLTVREFVRGLASSDVFRRLNHEPNTNYRFVEICVQRLLGRDIYNEREKIAWSIVIVSKGVRGFIDDLVDSEEYLANFGEDYVPFQRRRVLNQRDSGETPFNLKTPRYEAYHRQQLGFPQIVWQSTVRRFIPQEKQVRNGDPRQFLGVARGLASAKREGKTSVSAMNVDFLSKVPYRKAS